MKLKLNFHTACLADGSDKFLPESALAPFVIFCVIKNSLKALSGSNPFSA